MRVQKGRKGWESKDKWGGPARRIQVRGRSGALFDERVCGAQNKRGVRKSGEGVSVRGVKWPANRWAAAEEGEGRGREEKRREAKMVAAKKGRVCRVVGQVSLRA